MVSALVVTCVQCEAQIQVPEDAIVGEIISCPDCGASYEITSIDGENVTIKSIEIQAEDWGE